MAVSFLTGCGKGKDPAAALGDISYEEHVVSDTLVISVPETLEVENWGYNYITVRKPGEDWELVLGRGEYADDTAEATWEASKKMYENFYSGVKEYTVAGKKGIIFDKGAAVSVEVPIDDTYKFFLNLARSGDSAKDRRKVFDSPEIQVILDKLVIK